MPFTIQIRCPGHSSIQPYLRAEGSEVFVRVTDLLKVGLEDIEFPDGYENFFGEITCGAESPESKVTLIVKLDNKTVASLSQPPFTSVVFPNI